MGAMIERVVGIWLLMAGIGGATLLFDAVKNAGNSVVSATQQGLISLPTLNAMLFAPNMSGPIDRKRAPRNSRNR